MLQAAKIQSDCQQAANGGNGGQLHVKKQGLRRDPPNLVDV